MALWAKWFPRVSGSRSAPKFYVEHDADFFFNQFLELLQLLFCFCMVKAFTLKLRFKAAYLRLKLSYLSFKHRRLIQRKRKTLADYLRYRQVSDRVFGDIKQSHSAVRLSGSTPFATPLSASVEVNHHPHCDQ